MAAEVIASELQLDLYKIDLSQVVSKYIGETEKNLDQDLRRRAAATPSCSSTRPTRCSASARRSRTRTTATPTSKSSYLLQKMEEYEGIAILATNLPAEPGRGVRPAARCHRRLPVSRRRARASESGRPISRPRRRLGATSTMPVLARAMRLAGGNIKNIALTAAFLAADDGGAIAMDHVLRGAKREFEKIGKLWNEKEFVPPGG